MGEIENNFNQKPNFALNKCSWVIWSWANWTHMFLKVSHEKWAETDVPKEMWVMNAKGINYLNTGITFCDQYVNLRNRLEAKQVC